VSPAEPSDELVAAALSEERDLLAAVMENSPEANLVYLDRDFRFVLVNSTYADACQIPREELVGKNHFELFPNEENEKIFREVRDTKTAVVFRAKPFVFEQQPWRGVSYWDWSLTPLLDADDEVRGFVFSLVDVTDRERRLQLADSLAALDEIVHSTLDPEQILEHVAQEIPRAAGCESAGIVMREGEQWRAVYRDPLLRQRSEDHIFTPAQMPVAEIAAATRAPVVIADASAADAPIQEALEAFGVTSALNVPLFVRGEVVGVLGLHYHSEPVPFSRPVIDFAARLGTSLSLALSNARLYERLQEVRAFGDALNKVLTAFVSTIDPDDVLERVVQQSAEAMGADYAVISVVENGEWVVKHHFGRGGEMRVGVRDRYAQRPVMTDAAESQQIQIVEDAMAHPRTNKAIMSQFAIGAFAAVPLVLRGITTAVLELVYSTPTAFDENRIGFLERLMVTASLALEKARVYEHEHRIADTLQEAMLVLPPSLPGIEFASTYHGASDMGRVGGDFYDLLDLDKGLIGITIGDISGKGLDAAVLTSLVKNTIRAHATEQGRTPAGAVALANTVLFRGSDPATFATLFFGVLDPRDGKLLYCNAGHSTPFVVRVDGSLVPLAPNSPLVGAFAETPFLESDVKLGLGDQLFLYTDGLTEARSKGEMYGEGRLGRLLKEHAGAAPGESVQRALKAAVECAGGRLTDDVAILAVRRDPASLRR